MWHYSRYLQIFSAHNNITNTKCNEKISVLLIQPNPTQPMDGPNPCPSLVASHLKHFAALPCEIFRNVFDSQRGQWHAFLHHAVYKTHPTNRLAQLEARCYSYSENVSRVPYPKRKWNSLPPSVVDFRSLSSFKRTICNAHVNLFTRY